MVTPYEEDFKRVVRNLIGTRLYPSASTIHRYTIKGGRGCELNGRECRWRDEVFKEMKFPFHTRVFEFKEDGALWRSYYTVTGREVRSLTEYIEPHPYSWNINDWERDRIELGDAIQTLRKLQDVRRRRTTQGS